MACGRNWLTWATLFIVCCTAAVSAVDLQTAVLNAFNRDVQTVVATANGLSNTIRQLGKRLNSNLCTIQKAAKKNRNTALLAALPVVRKNMTGFFTTALNDTQNQLNALNASVTQIAASVATNMALLQSQRVSFLASVADSTPNDANGRLCAHHYYDSFEGQEMQVYLTMGNVVSAAMGALATAADKVDLLIAIADNVLTNHVANFASPNWTLDDAITYFSSALGRIQQAASSLATSNAQDLATAMDMLQGVNQPTSRLHMAMRNVMYGYAMCAKMPWPPAGKTQSAKMVAVAKAVLCGVLMVCNYVTRDQQTAAVDSYIAVMQSGLGSLQQNVARAQEIQSNVNYVWQQQMNNAVLIGDTGFVNALNAVKVQLDQYFAAYTTDATTILNTLDAWIKLIRSTFMTKTANYQLTRDLLMTSFNSSIAAGPGMMRSCAQHYYAQFEGIEYNLLLNIGKAYSTGAGTLATQAAGFTQLHNMNEDSIDNWNTVYNRITLRSSTMINDLRTAVQTMMTTVNAAIVVPATMTTTLNQVRSAYALCTRVG
ncbi:hypothetical protein pipiens_002749 [Culex pipiens pipiens]|uniref:Uncharacterized protein n=1 Tax=Culex pipiens pipiens TaxID=38569 RepID=A0ABD1D8Y5_CULPP